MTPIPGAPRRIADTVRLRLRELCATDAPFIRELLNDADFLRYIGDRGVRTLDNARGYIANGPGTSYAQHGFGLWLAELRDGGAPVGICGLLRREGMDDVELGFAFAAAHRGRGYAMEAARASLAFGFEALALPRIVAITDPDNAASQSLLRRLGLRDAGPLKVPGIDGDRAYFVVERRHEGD